MDLNNELVDRESSKVFEVKKDLNDALISLEECKKFLGKYDLSDDQILLIRNSIIGVSDCVINSYIDEFN